MLAWSRQESHAQSDNDSSSILPILYPHVNPQIFGGISGRLQFVPRYISAVYRLSQIVSNSNVCESVNITRIPKWNAKFTIPSMGKEKGHALSEHSLIA